VNETLIPGTLSYVVDTLKFLVGGVFGLYLIILVVRIIAYTKLRNRVDMLAGELGKIRKRINRLEKSLNTSKR
jgi:hypothetical protein